MVKALGGDARLQDTRFEYSTCLICSSIKQRRSSGLQKGKELAAQRRRMLTRVTGLGLRLCILMFPQVVTVFHNKKAICVRPMGYVTSLCPQ